MHPFLLLMIGMIVVIGGILWLRLHAFLALLMAAAIVAILTPSETFFFDRVAEGFGKTVGQIGILIAMASIIGDCMLRSGAADRIVRATLRMVGEERAPRAFLASGFVLGIPVFFDTVFYLTIPLIKALRLRTGRHYLWYILAVIAGGSMTHSLVPPTPGPLFVANALKIDLATMIVMGCVVGAFSSTAGYLFGKWANRRMDLPLRETGESLERMIELSRRDESGLPPTWLAILPILLPVILIGGAAVRHTAIWRTLGDKNIALVLGAAAAIFILFRWSGKEEVEEAVKDALTGAGSIILITSAGGAFGAVLQQTGIGAAIEKLSVQAAILPVAFLLTAMIRTAQGSATVAMITSAGVFSGLAQATQLGFHPVYLALAIGCGSKPVAWLNDSGFWVMTKMSGMTEKEGLKTITPLMLIMGLVGIVVTMILARIFPMI